MGAKQPVFSDLYPVSFLTSVPTSINRLVQKDVFLIVQFVDHSKLRFSCSVSISLRLCFVQQRLQMKVKLIVSADQNKHILVNGRIIQITENAVLNGPRTARLRNRILEVDGWENVVSSWTVMKTSSRAGRLALVGTALCGSKYTIVNDSRVLHYLTLKINTFAICDRSCQGLWNIVFEGIKVDLRSF